MRVTEKDVLAAATMRATYRGENVAMVSATVLELIDSLNTAYKGEAYMAELEKLYRQYATS